MVTDNREKRSKKVLKEKIHIVGREDTYCGK